jgi:hypothetical protein
MAELPKPSDFFLDVTSFFAIMIPGAVLTGAAVLGPTGLGPSLLPAAEPAARWIGFGVASYVVGQVIFALGSWLLDPTYDATYLAWRSRQRKTFRESVKRKLIAVYGRHAEETGVFPLARAFLLSFNPGAYLLVERIEADSKFFRSMTMAILLATIVLERRGPMAGLAVVGAGAIAAAGAALGLSLSRGSKLRNRLRQMIVLGLVVCTAGLVGILLLTSILWSGAFAVLAVVLFLRFSQQRWQRNETLNELVLLSFALQDRSRTIGETRPIIAACVDLALRAAQVARSEDEDEATSILNVGNRLLQERMPMLALHEQTQELSRYLKGVLRTTARFRAAVHTRMKHILDDDLNPPMPTEVKNEDNEAVLDEARRLKTASDDLLTQSRESLASLEVTVPDLPANSGQPLASHTGQQQGLG